jgi:HAD superfamily hydrolase (TIGR01509 family)
MPSVKDLDAVTVDAMGTLVELDDPVGRLSQALQRWNLDRSGEQVGAAFQREVAYYLEHKLEARDAAGLGDLRRRCAAVFLEGVGADIDPAEFSPAFVDSMVFAPVNGAVPALERLRATGLSLACVSDWDIGLEEQLAKVGLDDLFETVITSAETGAPKPEPPIFEEALRRLGVEANRAVHVGDAKSDRVGARAVGMAFETIPLATVPDRLGLR